MVSFSPFYQFIIILSNGRKIKKPIKDIHLLHESIRDYGIFAIKTIIFNFIVAIHNPYGVHNIVLYNTNKKSFKINFCHYYNSHNQLYIMPYEQQHVDYQALMTFLYSDKYLVEHLVPFIYII